MRKPPSVGKLYEMLSLRMHHSYRQNRDRLERVASYFQLAISLLAAEVVLWIIAIASDL